MARTVCMREIKRVKWIMFNNNLKIIEHITHVIKHIIKKCTSQKLIKSVFTNFNNDTHKDRRSRISPPPTFPNTLAIEWPVPRIWIKSNLKNELF